jgi:hypothetical protein
MSTDPTTLPRSAELLRHLTRFPEDLRDIRRLQRRFGLSAAEVAVALDAWRAQESNVRRLKDSLSH